MPGSSESGNWNENNYHMQMYDQIAKNSNSRLEVLETVTEDCEVSFSDVTMQPCAGEPSPAPTPRPTPVPFPAPTATPTSKPTTAPTYDNDFWSFGLTGDDDLVCIKEGPVTGTDMTEVHILGASTNYASWTLQTGTALSLTDSNWAFAVMDSGDLMCIKLANTGSGSTEVHILSASSNYGSFSLQTGTALHEISNPDDWSFGVNSDGDLIVIKRGSTGSSSTEVHILSASSNYASWSLQTGTALHETDEDRYAFAVKANGDVVCIIMSSTGSGSTEVHILSASSNYGSFSLQTGTALHEISNPEDWNFDVESNGDIMAIKRADTGTGTTEVHVLSASSNYGSWSLQTGTALHETA